MYKIEEKTRPRPVRIRAPSIASFAERTAGANKSGVCWIRLNDGTRWFYNTRRNRWIASTKGSVRLEKWFSGAKARNSDVVRSGSLLAHHRWEHRIDV